MSADLEETLAELGPDYRKVVDRLRAPFAGDEGRVDAAHEARGARRIGFLGPVATLLAASLAVAFAWPFLSAPAAAVAPGEPVCATGVARYTLALAPSAASVDEIVRTQSADGSWGNDFLPRQNAAALRNVASAHVAYCRALRYLRSKGLSPLSDAELRSRAAQASVQG